MVRVISIDASKERILGFLFPTYHLGDGVRHCIIHKNIRTKNEAESLELLYDDCIFISKAWYAELWDDERIKEETVSFSKRVLKSRRTKLVFEEGDDIVDKCVDFLFRYDTGNVEESNLSYLSTVLDNPQKFLTAHQQLVSTYGKERLSSYCEYAVKSIMGKGTVFYNRLKSLLGKYMRRNVTNAVTECNGRYDDMWGLSRAKMIMDICKK